MAYFPPEPIQLLGAEDRAAFATNARLLSCLVTESLVRAVYLSLEGFEASGVSVIIVEGAHGDKVLYEPEDILAIVPLRHVPVLKPDVANSIGRDISLLDPLDMMPLVFEITATGNEVSDSRSGEKSEHADLCTVIRNTLLDSGCALSGDTQLIVSESPLSVWHKFGISIKLDEGLIEDIGHELDSSMKWQTYSYHHPPPTPLFTSSSIEWEQSIVEGHPTHPVMHKTRRFLPPLPDFPPGAYDLYHPQLRLVCVPRENLNITYNFEELTRPILDAASRHANSTLDIKEGFVVVPVHELQISHIQAKFPEIEIYPPEFSLPLLAQQSIRSVIVPGVYRDLSLKLGVGIKLTSAVRTISPESAYLGPRFSTQVVPALTMDSEVVTVVKELASVVHAHSDGEIAKHCSIIVREAYEIASEEKGERLIVCTALVESGHAGVDGHIPAVIRVFNLDTEQKRLKWLDKYVHTFFRAFLPTVLENGVAFECHPQNCVARFDIKTKELKGFIVRDYGGIRVHPETLRASTGVQLDFVEGHSIIASDLDDVYTRMYHTVFHNHLQQLIRILGLHYNGLGWSIVRGRLSERIPKDHPLHAAWLSPDRTTFPGKCFLRMRMSGMYRFHLHGPFPNLTQYKGVEAQNSLLSKEQ